MPQPSPDDLAAAYRLVARPVRRIRIAYAAVLGIHCAATAAWAPPIATELEGAGWKILTVDGKRVTRFTRRDDGAIEIAAEQSVAAG